MFVIRTMTSILSVAGMQVVSHYLGHQSVCMIFMLKYCAYSTTSFRMVWMLMEKGCKRMANLPMRRRTIKTLASSRASSLVLFSVCEPI